MLIEQGKADTTVFPAFTDQLAAEYVKRGPASRTRPTTGSTTSRVVTGSAPAGDATRWIKSRL